MGHMGISVTEPERGHLPRVVEALEKGMIAAGWKGETKALEVYKAAL